MPESKLTHRQQVRLAALDHAGARNNAKMIPLAEHFKEAEQIEAWLWKVEKDVEK